MRSLLSSRGVRRILLIAFLWSCRPPPQGPEAALDAYLDALAQNQLDRAYSLLSSDYKKSHDRAAFERTVVASDAQKNATRLRKSAHQMELLAEIELPDGEKLPLVREGGEWKFQHDPLDFYPQSTPLEALRSFLRAVENHRYEIALNFVPDRYRATLTADKLRERWEGERKSELLAQLQAVRTHLGDPLETSGDEARLTVGERKQARLVREGGVWKVESLE
jgi:hypothetical protein